MRILSRYILREYLVPLCYCMVGFVAIYVLFELFGSFSRLVEAKLPAGVAVKYFFAYLAPYFQYLAPAALMLAALYTMWNFSRRSELVAMRSNGIAFHAIAAPILACAVAMAGVVAWMNEKYVPMNAQWATRLKSCRFDMAKAARGARLDYRNAKDSRIWSAERIFDASGNHLGEVTITEDRPEGARRWTLTADKADFLDGEWWLSGIAIQHYDESGAEKATPTPQLDALPVRVFTNLGETPRDLMAQSRKQQYNSVMGKLRHLATNTHLSEDTRREYEYAAWAQLMSPFACIIITLFAIPAGVSSGRQNIFKGILSALGAFFSFYALVIGGMIAANTGCIPPIPAATIPYAIFLVLGLNMFRKQR